MVPLSIPIAKKAFEMPSFIVMDVLERAQELEKQGKSIIHLEIGEPDFITPSCICEAAKKAIEKGQTHYTHSLGIVELREAIAEHYKEKYGVEIDPGQIIVTSGTSPAMLLIFSAVLEKGDEVILSDPHYPCYPNFVRFLDGKPVFVKVFEEEGFQLDANAIKQKITSRTKAVVINSPANPTGCLLSAQRMEEIASLGIPVISDEIYHGLTYAEKEHSILEFTDNAFVLNGFSKLYAMTGWRLGYLIAPKTFIRPLQKLQQNFFISASSISQWAGVAALTQARDDIEKMRQIYDQRRKYMISRLKELGFGLASEPKGAFYILVSAKHLSHSSYDLAFEILEGAGVGVTPGIDFGENAEGYLRFSYANSLDNIKEGLNRLENFLKER